MTQSTSISGKDAFNRNENATGFNLSLWALNLSQRIASCDEWIGMVKDELTNAAAKRADILLMPEYACEQWMAFAPSDVKPTQELAWMSAQAISNNVVGKLQDAVKETGVALVAGTIPWPVEGKDNAFTNRTWTLFPDREPIFYDKLVMTPFEKNPDGWTLTTGKELKIYEWRGVRFGQVVCLDIEMPALSTKLAEKNIDILLVPSMTEKASGYHRVFDCAKARAVETMASVAVAGCVGTPWHGDKPRYGNYGGAAVFVPCEELLGSTGVLSQIPGKNISEGNGEILHVSIPVETIRNIRMNKPEAWPGPWNAMHVDVSDEATKKPVTGTDFPKPDKREIN